MMDHILARDGPFANLGKLVYLSELKRLVANLYPQGISLVGEFREIILRSQAVFREVPQMIPIRNALR